MNSPYHSYMKPEGDELVGWLNAHPRSRIATWLRGFSIQRQAVIGPADYPGVHRLTGVSPEAIMQLARHPKRLRRGKTFDPSAPFTVRFRLQPPIETGRQYDVRVLPVSEDHSAALFLLLLASARQVHRLRLCEHCHKWHFARRENQKFCGVGCRVKARVSREPAETRRQKHTSYMRDYRQRLKANPNLKIGENRTRREKNQ